MGINCSIHTDINSYKESVGAKADGSLYNFECGEHVMIDETRFVHRVGCFCFVENCMEIVNYCSTLIDIHAVIKCNLFQYCVITGHVLN